MCLIRHVLISFNSWIYVLCKFISWQHKTTKVDIAQLIAIHKGSILSKDMLVHSLMFNGFSKLSEGKKSQMMSSEVLQSFLP